MKAQRRHELQTNTLALWMRWKAPELWAKYGTHILLGIIIVMLGIVLIRHLMNKPIEEANRAADYLVSAREQIRELNEGVKSPGEARGILTQIQQAMEQSKRPEIQSEAQLALGDYYWALFNAPLPFADSRPVEVPTETPQEMLDKAQAAYEASMKDGSIRPYVTTRARFGLAAVAEARGFDAMRKAGFKAVDVSAFWEKAKEQYQAILDDPTTPQELKDEARWRLEQLKETDQPIWVAAPPPTTATSGPSTQGNGGLQGLQGLLTPEAPTGLKPVTTNPATKPTK